jgi:8-oxo-dGTP diphosphatase
MTIVVTAAIVEDHGRYFVTRRLKGTHLEGCWEFPGGKIEPGESLADGLRRELREELGTEVSVGQEVFSVTHHYDDRSVELHFLACTFLNAPVARLGQEMRWVARDELPSLEFPPADAELIARLVAQGFNPAPGQS